ncbi:MAG: hypothetical protein ACREVM_06580 [Burkholderiales bacterium]
MKFITVSGPASMEAHPQMCEAQICAMRELPWNACLMRVSAAAFFLLIQVKGFQCSGEHF